LARLHRTVADLSTRQAIEAQFDSAFAADNVAGELRYLQRPSARHFERPYGWAWLLMLCHELSLHQHEKGWRWHAMLMPMADHFADCFLEFLPKADYPMRTGLHGNSAFATVLALQFAESHGHQRLASLLKSKARGWYLADADCQVWEPSQSDFLSPALIEALCMLRVLPREEFLVWFDRFLPGLRDRKPAVLFAPAQVSDRTDGHISHLDGLNLSRAWCFSAIADALPAKDRLADILTGAADAHLSASLQHVFGDYVGEHWLATFALLALSK
jgi:hypothetical protein